ncbi:MAG: hypothetical protein HXY22_09870 [Alphaproteobacteria bacterium]|nr:hypothetical protein [Alphaproteobacteria bacterium]
MRAKLASSAGAGGATQEAARKAGARKLQSAFAFVRTGPHARVMRVTLDAANDNSPPEVRGLDWVQAAIFAAGFALSGLAVYFGW